MIHAQALRDVVRKTLDDRLGFAFAWDETTEREVAPFYRAQIAADRARVAEMNALRLGAEPPPADPFMAAARRAMAYDADVFRGMVEIVNCLALPEEVFARPGFADLVQKIAAEHEALVVPGPSRTELLELVA
jgi:hypothetical protein